MTRSKYRDRPLAPIDVLPQASADGDDELRSEPGLDVNHIESATEAGLGGGLDQSEEAQFGVSITDEELEIMRRQPHRITRNPFR